MTSSPPPGGTTHDPVVRAASEVVGGPAGRYAVHRPLRWQLIAAIFMALSSLTVAFGVVIRVPCIRDAWASPDEFWHACFSDLPSTYVGAGLGHGVGALLQGSASSPTPEQPPLTALVMAILGSLTPDGAGRSPDDMVAHQMKVYFGLWAILGAILVCLMVWFVAGSVRREPMRAAHVALAPVVALTLVLSPDILGVALATAGIWAWGRSRPTAAGVLLGLAISARSYPVLIVIAIGLLSVRAGALRAFGRTLAATMLTVVGVFATFFLLNSEAATRAYGAWADAGASYGSPWFIPDLLGAPWPAGVTTGLAVGGWVLALIAGGYLALGSPRRPSVAEVSLVMVAIVLVTGKSFTVQSSLWLVPLVALTTLDWRDHLTWAGAESLHFVAVWLTIATVSTPDRGMPYTWYSIFLVIRLASVSWLAVQTWLTAWQRLPDVLTQVGDAGDLGEVPEPAVALDVAQRINRFDETGSFDEVETADRIEETAAAVEETDPCAGPLTGLPDRFIVNVA